MMKARSCRLCKEMATNYFVSFQIEERIYPSIPEEQVFQLPAYCDSHFEKNVQQTAEMFS